MRLMLATRPLIPLSTLLPAANSSKVSVSSTVRVEFKRTKTLLTRKEMRSILAGRTSCRQQAS